MKSLNKPQTYYMTPIFAIDRLRMGTDRHGIITLVCFMAVRFGLNYPQTKGLQHERKR